MNTELKPSCDISLKTWLSHEEVCVYTTLSDKTIRKARNEANLPYIVVMGRILHERTIVDAWIKKQSMYGKNASKRLINP